MSKEYTFKKYFVKSDIEIDGYKFHQGSIIYAKRFTNRHGYEIIKDGIIFDLIPNIIFCDEELYTKNCVNIKHLMCEWRDYLIDEVLSTSSIK